MKGPGHERPGMEEPMADTRNPNRKPKPLAEVLYWPTGEALTTGALSRAAREVAAELVDEALRLTARRGHRPSAADCLKARQLLAEAPVDRAEYARRLAATRRPQPGRRVSAVLSEDLAERAFDLAARAAVPVGVLVRVALSDLLEADETERPRPRPVLVN